jgi:ferredoxin--NADP+ reductase
MSEALSASEIAQLRAEHYNATLAEVISIHSDLAILRVSPDDGPLEYLPGQYTVLGLGNWEPRVPDVQAELLADEQTRQVVKRAYSISSRMLDNQGRLLRPSDSGHVEFYVTLVRAARPHPPALSPRLFALRQGARLYLGPRAHGTYTLEGLPPEADVVFAATGTGEAPHNAMLAELLATGHKGRIALVTCVRYQHDLAYLATHRELERRFAHYKYIGLTTREPWNLDASRADYVGKCHLQDFFAPWEGASRFERAWGAKLDPARTHVYLCGNPAMIGIPRLSAGEWVYPEPVGLVEILHHRGFRLDMPHAPGNIHVEKYW